MDSVLVVGEPAAKAGVHRIDGRNRPPLLLVGFDLPEQGTDRGLICAFVAEPVDLLAETADTRTSEEVRHQVGAIHATLDPVQLLRTIRAGQQELVEIADRPPDGAATAPTATTVEQFLCGLRTAWQEGEVRPTSKPKERRPGAAGGVPTRS
jgi:hypothetical protein